MRAPPFLGGAPGIFLLSLHPRGRRETLAQHEVGQRLTRAEQHVDLGGRQRWSCGLNPGRGSCPSDAPCWCQAGVRWCWGRPGIPGQRTSPLQVSGPASSAPRRGAEGGSCSHSRRSQAPGIVVGGGQQQGAGSHHAPGVGVLTRLGGRLDGSLRGSCWGWQGPIPKHCWALPWSPCAPRRPSVGCTGPRPRPGVPTAPAPRGLGTGHHTGQAAPCSCGQSSFLGREGAGPAFPAPRSGRSGASSGSTASPSGRWRP